MNHTAEMSLFHAVAQGGSLSAAARELGLSLPAVSKRLGALEARLGVRLLNRTTRRMTLTDEGGVYWQMASRILADIAAMDETMTARRASPKGLLRVNATLGFGRTHIAPAISAFARQHTEVQVQLHLSDQPLNLIDAGYDVGIRAGNLPDAALVARKIHDNRRIVCAAPAYLKRHGTPKTVADLAAHDCIVLRDNTSAFAQWRFGSADTAKVTASIKVRGSLSANDGQAVVQWALEGHGIVLRSDWEVAPLIAAGRLVPLLTHVVPADAAIYAVYPQRRHLPAKVRVFIDFLVLRFAARRDDR